MKKNITNFHIIILFLFILFGVNSIANTIDMGNIVLPKKLGANNFGNEFWLSIPPCNETDIKDTNNKVRFFIYSFTKTNVKLNIESNSYFVQDTAYPNKILEFSIHSSIAQPYQKLWQDETPDDKIYEKKGIHIESESPIMVYVIIKYRTSADGFLAIPVSSLGEEYIITPYTQPKAESGKNIFHLPGTVTIVSAFDSTEVFFKLGGNDSSRTKSGIISGESKTGTLMAGDVWILNTGNPGSDLSGSRITSSKPVSVLSGNYCVNIPPDNQYCDYTVEMNNPVFSYGKYYPVPILPERKYPPVIRIFSVNPNTNIYLNGNLIGGLDGSGLQDKGWLEMRLNNHDTIAAPAVINSEEPIFVSFYNPGTKEDGAPYPEGDPFEMNIIPSEQYNDEAYIIIPNEEIAQYFKKNYLNIISEKNGNENIIDAFLATNLLSPEPKWYKLSDLFKVTEKKFPLNNNLTMFNVELTDRGAYKIRSFAKFVSYSRGNGWLDEYGFPSGSLFVDLTKNDKNPPKVIITKYLAIDSLSHDYQIIEGIADDDPDTTNAQCNLSMIFMIKDLSYNYKFDYIKFIPGKTKKTNWQLNVIDPYQDARSVLFFSDRCGNDTIVEYNYSKLVTVDENKQNNTGISIFPNPSSGFLIISLKEIYEYPFTIGIYNTQGGKIKELRYTNLSSQFTYINLTGIPSGIYLLQVKYNKQIISKIFTILK
jgi:hypothetical protein